MSRAKVDSIESVRQLLIAELQKPDGVSLTELARRLGGSPTRQALQGFADGKGGASFWKRVGRALQGEQDLPDLVEEAEAALRLVREAEAAMLRVTERLRQLPMTDDILATVDAADATLLEPPGDPLGTRSAGAAASGPRRRKAR